MYGWWIFEQKVFSSTKSTYKQVQLPSWLSPWGLILYHSSLICKSAQGVHNTVRNNTRPQASAFMEYGHKEKADRSGIDDLAYVGNQFHSTPIKQINNMPYSKQNTGNYNGSFHVVIA